MDTLRALEAFVHSVELGSLSGAARALDTTQPTVSKLVAGLERSLGVRLLRRTAAGLSLTEEGQRFHERARRMLEDYGDAVSDVREGIQQPRGLLRMSAPVTMGQRHLNAMAVEFLGLYPDIELELVLDDRFVDPLEERIDVSLRVGGALPPDLVARHLGTWPRVLVASPDYIAARGKPRKPQDLLAHDYLRYAAGDDGVLLQGPDGPVTVPVRSRYRVNNAVALLDSVLGGAGISLQPTWMVADLLEQGRLVRLLGRHTGPAQEVHLLYAPRRHQPLRVRVLVDFLAERVAKLPGASRPVTR
ncbi:DNA-binding transcriptional regulator, LysR family [Variovorax sp. YR634]|jgi:DNA-binding transcriptional LysR family regulator|uniref:LysR family transcriptional regulator n=1 Tax=unclassified Variovorax TaxID=663243 RepID=UPI0008991B6F|nr:MULTISPECIES: LysR family transcriptional regulator [unclassified Variovorax]SDX87006.1 DNA-binding transcriptional regulator, LysR family [Variovorax sp. YR634]SDZ37019.1 DNA-binding transcriptional regulator, LysR family [Variovorax sp. YR266]SOD27464.1 DNA-binding transcriptional regulator, LysR family [Variovorax sp. YR752]